MLIFFLAFSHPEIPHDVSLFVFAPHHIFVDYQPLKAYRTPRMYLPRADTHLRAEPISKTVREARASVDKCPSRVDTTTELGSIYF